MHMQYAVQAFQGIAYVLRTRLKSVTLNCCICDIQGEPKVPRPTQDGITLEIEEIRG